MIDISDKDIRYKIVFFTGAGISKESGIPTFDEMEGIRDKLTRAFATKHPEEYSTVVQDFIRMLSDKEPNAAHRAIATVDAPVITMNIDQLHQKAGSKDVLEIHGTLPDNLILYGDTAPLYGVAKKLVQKLRYGASYFVVVGTSFYTAISRDLLRIAKHRKAKVIIVNDHATARVPDIVSQIKG